MDRRRALALIGTGGLAGAGRAAGAEQAPQLAVALALPEAYDGNDGKPIGPLALRRWGSGSRFYAVVENLSGADQFVWAAWNAWVASPLSFEVVDADGTRTIVARSPQAPSRPHLPAERLAPGAKVVREVVYDPEPGKPSFGYSFPFGPAGSRREVTIRAVFAQAPAPPGTRLATWVGRVVSPDYRVVLATD